MGSGAGGWAVAPPMGRSTVPISTITRAVTTSVRRVEVSGIASPVQGEEASRVLAEDLTLGALAEPAHVLAQLLDGAGEDRVPVRVVRRPAHVVLADVIDHGGDGGLVRITRDHALPTEHGHRVVLEPRHLLRALLPVLVHAVQPEGQPGAPGLEERDFQAREALEHAARDH